MDNLAQIAYEAYAEHQKWKTFRGTVIPPWDEQEEDIKAAWQAVVDAILAV